MLHYRHKLSYLFSAKEASQIEHSGQDGPFAFIYAVATLT